jgi:aryl-alcohol dehydrogenase-like predicted oxidoreductase
LEPIVCLQNQYNLLKRWKIEPELLPLCRRYGLGLMTYSPLAIGLLSGRFRRGEEPPTGTPWNQERLQRVMTEKVDRVVQTLIDLAGRRGATPAQMAIAWLLHHPEVTAPITGADRPEYVDDVFSALEINLTRDERQILDEVSQWQEPGQ